MPTNHAFMAMNGDLMVKYGNGMMYIYICMYEMYEIVYGFI